MQSDIFLIATTTLLAQTQTKPSCGLCHCAKLSGNSVPARHISEGAAPAHCLVPCLIYTAPCLNEKKKIMSFAH